MSDNAELESELKTLMVDSLGLEDVKAEDIKSDQPLFEEGLELDSIDALELVMTVSKKYGIKMSGKDAGMRENFATVATLARFVAANRTVR